MHVSTTDHTPGFPSSPLVPSEVPAPSSPAATTEMVGVNSTPPITKSLASETGVPATVLSGTASEKSSFSSAQATVSSTLMPSGSSASGSTVAPHSSYSPTPSGHAVHNAGLGGAMLAGAVGFAALVAM